MPGLLPNQRCPTNSVNVLMAELFHKPNMHTRSQFMFSSFTNLQLIQLSHHLIAAAGFFTAGQMPFLPAY